MDNPHFSAAPVWRGAWPAGGRPLAVLLHGRTQTPEFMLGVAERLALPLLDAVALAAHGSSWYPDKFMAPLAANQPWLDHALARLDHLVAEAIGQGIAPERIAFIGFSQGACLASEFVYRRAQRFAALIGFTGGLIGPPETAWPINGQPLAGMPVLLCNGDADPWVPLQRTRQTADVLRAMGARVAERVYPGREHEVGDDEIAAARALLHAL